MLFSQCCVVGHCTAGAPPADCAAPAAAAARGGQQMAWTDGAPGANVRIGLGEGQTQALIQSHATNDSSRHI